MSVDAWAAVVLGGPTAAVALCALVLPTTATPAAALIGRQGWRSVWEWTVRPYRSTALPALGIALAEYLGAALSTQGLRPLLFADDPELGWYLPLVGLVLGVLLGWVLIALVVIPFKAAARAVSIWQSDRHEAVRLLVFPFVMLAILLTGAAHLGAFPQTAEVGRLAMLQDERDLLFTPGASGAPAWCVAFAWAGVAAVLAAGISVRWTTRATRQVTQPGP
ncbi:hypothetical protein [Pedococcus sp. P5_B7]